MRGLRRAGLSVLALSLCLAFASPAAATARPPAAAASSGAAAAASSSRWIAVSVATLWVKPGLARPVDAPAIAAAADPRAWVAGMTTTQRRWLVGKLETQALYGTRVTLLATSGAWSRVAVPGQPTPRDSRGYPGWVPTEQLSPVRPVTGPSVAVIRRPTAWAWETPSLTGRVLELSYGTRLPALAWTTSSVQVATLDGRSLYVKRAAVMLRSRGAPRPRPSGAQLAAEARRFLGAQCSISDLQLLLLGLQRLLGGFVLPRQFAQTLIVPGCFPLFDRSHYRLKNRREIVLVLYGGGT